MWELKYSYTTGGDKISNAVKQKSMEFLDPSQKKKAKNRFSP